VIGVDSAMSKPTTVMVGEWHGERPGLREPGRCTFDLDIVIGATTAVATSTVGPAPAPGSASTAGTMRSAGTIVDLSAARLTATMFKPIGASRTGHCVLHGDAGRPVSSPVCGGMQIEATSIEPQRALHGPHELGDREVLEVQRRSGPLDHHVLPVRCVAGSDVVIHEARAAPQRPSRGHVWLVGRRGIMVPATALRPIRASCAARTAG
jgi:hypothetical protein